MGNLDVAFVAIEVHLVLFGPTHITVFLAQFVWALLPGLRGLPPFFNILVLVLAIALFGYFNKRSIDNLSGFCEDTLLVKSLLEAVKHDLNYLFSNKRFAELPNRLAVGYPAA